MKNKKIINSTTSPQAIGAYSQAIAYNDLIFTSAQIPIDKDTNEIVSSNFKDQVYLTLENLKNLIISSDSDLNKIVKLNVYLIDLIFFDQLNEAFIKYFDGEYPARTVVQVSKLPKESKIAIDAICFK